MHIACFKHVSFEGPAAIATWAESRGHTIECVEVYTGAELPSLSAYDMLVVMGGPMNIYDEAQHPWLAAEKIAIRAAIDARKPVVGVCLGGQLIADVLGGPVTRGEHTEIGWFDIMRAQNRPEMPSLPNTLRVYHWHGDTFALPPEAQLLASSAGCRNQIYLYRDRVLGFQCHLETTPESMHALIEACADEIGEGRYIQSAEVMRQEPQETFTAMQQVLFQLLDEVAQDD